MDKQLMELLVRVCKEEQKINELLKEIQEIRERIVKKIGGR